MNEINSILSNLGIREKLEKKQSRNISFFISEWHSDIAVFTCLEEFEAFHSQFLKDKLKEYKGAFSYSKVRKVDIKGLGRRYEDVKNVIKLEDEFYINRSKFNLRTLLKKANLIRVLRDERAIILQFEYKLNFIIVLFQKDDLEALREVLEIVMKNNAIEVKAWEQI